MSEAQVSKRPVEVQAANIERVWIERSEQTVRKERRKVQQSIFETHVIRNTNDGRTYENTIDHLSKSERKVSGLR